MGWSKYHEDIVSRRVGDKHTGCAPKSTTMPSKQTETKIPQQEEHVSKLKEFVVSSARPLPVIVLADVSGSMGADGKIQALNYAVREMIETFLDESDLRAEICVSVITFGGQSRVHLPLGPACDASWSDLGASGRTPMGAAFDLARQMIEDEEVVPGRAYRPTIVLVSDGQPTDAWHSPLQALLGSERGGKAFRMALAIGADADLSVLQEFLADPEARVYRADEARQIRQFFQLVTMSVSARSRSANPNSSPESLPNEGWDL